jgi:hypothetical protein
VAPEGTKGATLCRMKNLIFRIFNLTFGKFIRLFQKSLIPRNSPQGVFHLINQQALQDSAQYAQNNFSKAMQFDTRQELWSYCLNRIPQLQMGGVIAEFGVWKGESINFFAKSCPNARVFGFDSFEGLEEDWHGTRLQKGFFSMNGQLPKCESNVNLLKGWFEDTLPKFLGELQQEKILFLHMDADTYKPTAYVLSSLLNNFGKGTIIIFDEYFGYPSFRLHEFKAWQELVNSSGLEYRYIGYTEMQVAIEIL